MGPIFSLADLIGMLRRRAAVILYVTVRGSILSIWVALNQQHVYQSVEVIQVTQPVIASGVGS